MTRDEIIPFLKGNFYKRVRHCSFSPGEYIYYAEDGNIYDENGYLFEDWNSPSRCGLRIRSGGNWEDGWEIIDYYRNESLVPDKKIANWNLPTIAELPRKIS